MNSSKLPSGVFSPVQLSQNPNFVNPVQAASTGYAVKKLKAFRDQTYQDYLDAEKNAKKFKFYNYLLLGLFLLCSSFPGIYWLFTLKATAFSPVSALTAFFLLTYHQRMGIGKKPVQFKFISLRYFLIYQQINDALNMSLFENGQEIMQYLGQVQDELNEIELNLFEFTHGPNVMGYDDGVVKPLKDQNDQDDPEDNEDNGGRKKRKNRG